MTELTGISGIPLVDAEDVKTSRGGGRKAGGQKYSKYALIIAPHVDFLKEKILASKDGRIRVRKDDISGEFKDKHPTSVYWGLKYILFNQGIWVTQGKHRDGTDLLIMRIATPEDRLPESLNKSNKVVSKETDTEDGLKE